MTPKSRPYFVAPAHTRVDPFVSAADALDPPANRWREDPVAWARERGGTRLWSKQRAILESVRDNVYTVVHSCNSAGKSHTAATAVEWWIDSYPAGDAMAVTTAPTEAQVKGILWKYINATHEERGLPGRVNQTEWHIGSQMVGLGRKPGDYTTAGFSGYHAPHLLIVIDEGSGVTANIWNSLNTLTAGGHCRILAIGNPDITTGPFHEACTRPDTGWKVFHIGRWDMPSHTGEDVGEAASRVLMSQEWADDRKRAWGEDSALYQSKVLGLFPKQGSQFAVVPHDAATACRVLDTPERPGDVVEAGVDLGAGRDRTVVRERRGTRAGRVLEFRSSDPLVTADAICEALKAWGVTRVKVDSIGIGWTMVGLLRRDLMGAGIEVVPVNFGEGPTATNKDRFLNLRAEVWWTVGREYSLNRAWDLGAVDDDTIAELTAPDYVIMDSKGKVKVEPKDDVRKRIGMSPDQADALLLAFWSPAWNATMPGLSAMMGRDLLAGTRM
jgi:hypothetical protein